MTTDKLSAADVFPRLTPFTWEAVKEVTVIKQPCCQPGIFTTTGVGRSPVEKCCNPSPKERQDAFNKAIQAAANWAKAICATNPACPNVEFVKYENVKDDCQKCEVVIEVTIQWHCVEKPKKDEKPKKEGEKMIPAGPTRPIITERTRRTR